MRWIRTTPNPVRGKTPFPPTHLTVTSGQDLVLPQWLALTRVRGCVQFLLDWMQLVPLDARHRAAEFQRDRQLLLPRLGQRRLVRRLSPTARCGSLEFLAQPRMRRILLLLSGN